MEPSSGKWLTAMAHFARPKPVFPFQNINLSIMAKRGIVLCRLTSSRYSIPSFIRGALRDTRRVWLGVL